MKWLFDKVDSYIKQSNWKDWALLKFCLFSMGVIAGSFTDKKYRLPVRITAFVVFIATYIKLMSGFMAVLFARGETR